MAHGEGRLHDDLYTRGVPLNRYSTGVQQACLHQLWLPYIYDNPNYRRRATPPISSDDVHTCFEHNPLSHPLASSSYGVRAPQCRCHCFRWGGRYRMPPRVERIRDCAGGSLHSKVEQVGSLQSVNVKGCNARCSGEHALADGADAGAVSALPIGQGMVFPCTHRAHVSIPLDIGVASTTRCKMIEELLGGGTLKQRRVRPHIEDGAILEFKDNVWVSKSGQVSRGYRHPVGYMLEQLRNNG